jgi:hypothetical protein
MLEAFSFKVTLHSLNVPVTSVRFLDQLRDLALLLCLFQLLWMFVSQEGKLGVSNSKEGQMTRFKKGEIPQRGN